MTIDPAAVPESGPKYVREAKIDARKCVVVNDIKVLTSNNVIRTDETSKSGTSRGCIELYGAGQSRGGEVRVPHCIGHHEVDSSIEEALKVFLEAEVGVERIWYTGGELDEDIYVTVPSIESFAGCRAERAEALHAVRATRPGDRLTVQNRG